MIAFQAVKLTDCISITKCDSGLTYELKTNSWREAVEFITKTKSDLNVVMHLDDFTRVLFYLLTDADRERAEKTERVFVDNAKIFYVPGRFLGITVSHYEGNFVRKAETNIQALKWWVSEDESEPQNVKELYDLGNSIVKALEVLNIKPTKLTSPVGVFCEHKMQDHYPTVWTFPEDKLECFDYASEFMRFEWRSAFMSGFFPETHLYDIVSAYPAAIRLLPSTDNCRCEYSKTRPAWANWGVMKGKITVDVDVSPFVYEKEDRFNPKGTWEGFFTTGEIKWLEKWQAGKFELIDGWWFAFGIAKPYQKAIDWLFKYKNQTEDKMVSTIAKKMSQGISGKLDEDRADGSKGDFYNPILAAMVRSYTRLQVAEFIYQNKLQDNLIAVLVDSALSTKPVTLPETAEIGCWRTEPTLPAIVLSKGAIWRPGKRPMGISYEDLLSSLKAKPDSAYFEFGENRSIDLTLATLDREFADYPQSGADVLNKVSKSQAIEIKD